MKRLSKEFFEKERPHVVNESKSAIAPISWPAQVLSGEKKVSFTLAENNKKK